VDTRHIFPVKRPEGRTNCRLGRALLALCLVATLAACSVGPGATQSEPVTVHFGYFPNLTHAQALIGVANGAFQQALGPDVKLEPTVFNAGPSEIEAMFAGKLDIGYIGPNPAVNGYVKSNGDALRIIAGATSGGAVLVVRADAGIHSAADFEGKRIASPQLANTQDVSLRHWLLANGHQLSETGGKTSVLPTNNPDILTLFRKKELDAAWVPEPWGAQLQVDAGAQLFLDERDLWPGGQFATTELIVSRKFLSDHPDIVEKFVTAHVELTQWIIQHPDDAKTIANKEIQRLSGVALSQAVLDLAWSRLNVTYDPLQASVFTSSDWAFADGFLGDQKPDLGHLFDLSVLNEVLKAKNLPAIAQVQP